MTKPTLSEALAILTPRLNTDKYIALDPTKQQAYLDMSYDYLASLALDIPTPTPDCVINAIAIMAAHDVENSITIGTTSGGEIIAAKVASISVTYAEGTNKAKVSRVPEDVSWCLSKYGYSKSCGIRQCKIGRA